MEVDEPPMSGGSVVYQKPLQFSKQLPYSDKVETEANEMFERIKRNLSSAVQKRELWPGAMFWSLRLQSYLNVYDLHFTKEDHIHLVKLLYELVIIPNVDSGLLSIWCSVLTKLLRKQRKLSPKDLQLPWKPLYNFIHDAVQSKFKRLGMKTYSDRTIATVRQLVEHVRCYFPAESTQEMLDEWRPLLCPFDTSMIEASQYFSEFLPTLVPVDQHENTYKLWFDELVHLWLIAGNHSLLEENWVKLFVRFADDTIGFIDWTPYMEQIFTRILNSFNLPMGPPEFQVKSSFNGGNKDPWSGDKSATLIVSFLGGGSPAQDHLNKLMIALESYYHPSNIGSHTKKLMAFLKNLTFRFVMRVKRERIRKSSWKPAIPSNSKLTEEDIDSFVQCLLPVVKLALYTRRGIYEAALCVKNLAELRPIMILPELMERTYAALETLTEPHQVVSTLSCVTAVVRTLVSDERYPEGRTHIFDLLRLALPGIDLNDIQKMLSSSLLISALASLVLFIDCSSAVGNVEMTEVEADICSLTSQFEDFVVQLIDRFFQLIETSAISSQGSVDIGRIVGSSKHDSTELLMSAGIAGSIHSILAHCSPEIFKVAFDKLFRFATSNVFANESAGRMCAEMCGTACRIDPSTTLNKFIPHVTSRISEVLEDTEQIDAEDPDVELIWNLQLLSNVVLADGYVLPQYGDQLISCLKQCVHLKSKKASKHAATALYSMLYALTQIYPMDSSIISQPLNLSPKDHLYIRDWGVSCKIEDSNIKWYVPNSEGLAFVNRLLDEFLQPELQSLQDFMDEKKTLDRDALCQSLGLVELIVKGITSILPSIQGPVVDGCVESLVSLERLFHITSNADFSPPEAYTRERLTLFIHKLTRHVMKTCEDDTKSLLALIGISKLLLINFGVDKQEYEGRNQGLNQIKLTMMSNLHGKKKLVRPLIVAKCHLLHEYRMKDHFLSLIRRPHLLLLENLADLSISAYPEVRVLAQQSLNGSLENYLSGCRKLLPRFIPYLKNSDSVTHEQFKGSLFVIASPLMTLTIVRNWDMTVEFLPVLVQADHSEKPSILALISHIHNNIQKLYDNFAINHKVTGESVLSAETLFEPVGQNELPENQKRLEDLNSGRLRSYVKLIEELVNITEAQHDLTQWRFTEITIKLLVMLIRRDVPYPLKAIKLLVNCLINDSLAIRKVAVFATTLILQKLKRPHKRVVVNPEEFSSVEILNPLHTSPGEREDNKWLCLMDNKELNETEWNSNNGSINKTRYGFYCYPKSLEGYAPISEQPALNRPVEEMTEDEVFIYTTFKNKDFVSKLISFLSLEENKGKDQFDTHRSNMFKNLFRNYGSCLAEEFRPHLEKLAVDSQESSQRCSCEIITGLVRAMKHWEHSMVMEIRKWLEPLLTNALTAIQPETSEDWYQCFSDISADRDPKRVNWLFKILTSLPLIGNNGSFVESSRLSIIQATLAQQQWRVPFVLKEILEYLFTQLDHPFKNVREKIGSLISNVYLMDISYTGFQTLYSPFLSNMLEVFAQRIPEDAQTLSRIPPDSKELKICKTAMSIIIHSYQPSAVQYYELFSKLVPLTSYEGDDEVGTLIILMCKQLCRRELSPALIPPILESLKKATSLGLWKAKIPVLLILQVLVFCNLFTFSSVADEICDLLLSLVEDNQIEIREVASSTVSGLIRCGFLTHSKVKKHFTKHSRTRINHKIKRRNNIQNGETEEVDAAQKDKETANQEGHLVLRHSGVLGLAALVEACPYTVPEWLPEVVDELSTHLNDPAPINATVKKTISEFKRTHHDNWREHKLKFTEDQLSTLSELDVSPSYYA